MGPVEQYLFRLTVVEHLEFYGQLKGLSRAEAKVQVPMSVCVARAICC